MMGHRELPITAGVEEDVFTGWRRRYCYTQRAGICKRVKRGFARRVRRFANKLVHNVLLGLPEEP